MSTSTLAKWRSIQTNDKILTKDLSRPDDKLANSFSTSMEFGTAGIRGLMGAGTNKMNVHTVSAAAQAYAEYLIKNKAIKNGVVIGHDNRHNSALFSIETAKVFEKNGIKSYLFENNDLQPTPLVSYTVRKMKLGGAVIITASHNPKEYNGFKVYNSLGGQLMPSETKQISELMKSINPLEVNKKEWVPRYVPQEVLSTYKNMVLALTLTEGNKSNVKVVFSAQHGTAAKLAPELLERMGVQYKVVEKQQTPDPDFRHTKTPNPEDGKSFAKAEKLARRWKADIMVTTDPDADRLGVAIKYKKRWKFLNGNETATLYLDYLLTQLKIQNKLPKNGFIATTHVSSVIADKIAARFGVKVYKTHVGFKNIADLIESNPNEKFLFGFEESYGFLINSSIARDKDSLQAMVGIVDMISYYKSQNINAFEHLKEIFKSFGIHRTTQINKKLNESQQNTLFKKLTSLKAIGDHKVSEIQDFRKSKDKSNMVRVVFKGGSWIAARPSGTEPKVKIYVENIGSHGEKLLDLVAFEREVSDWVQDNTEEFEDKHWSWKAFWKYVIFSAIIVGVMVFVFEIVYSSSTKHGESVNVFSVAQAITNESSRWIWLSLWLWILFTKVIGAWMKIRMFQRLKARVSLRHVLISQVMGSIIGFITPFAVGGDAIGYWYLRRKGVPRAPLVAVLMSATLWAEIKFALQTIVLVWIGWHLYQHIFNTGDVQAHAALIWFFIGLSWSWFAAFMILILTTNKTIQEFIVRNTIILLEWLPFIHIYDPAGKASNVQYDFKLTRTGMKLIWNKWWFVLEMAFYDLFPLFFNPFAIVFATNGIVSPDAPSGSYWSQIVANDIVGTANSMSLTPGGSGTGEWLGITINQTLYGGTNLSTRFNVDTIASGTDLQWKILWYWPDLVLSSLTILIGLLFVRKKQLRPFVKKSGRVIFATTLLSVFAIAVCFLIFMI